MHQIKVCVLITDGFNWIQAYPTREKDDAVQMLLREIDRDAYRCSSRLIPGNFAHIVAEPNDMS